MYATLYQEKKDMDELKAEFAALSLRLNEMAAALTAQGVEIAQTTEVARSTLAAQEALVASQTPIEVVEYQDVSVNVSVPRDVALDIYKTLPEFNGERKKYSSWRRSASKAMDLLKNYKTSTRYFEALMIVRNKVIGPASYILDNYDTAFNFEAIIDRLDFSYADKRPLCILEHELTILQQNRLTIDAFYDLVNEKLNMIVNKINMTYKEKHTAKSFIESANEKALRTFITGLNDRKGETLYAANPASLPEAYARLQTIINDRERMSFANRYNVKTEEKMRNPQFKQQNRYVEKHQDSSKPNGYQNWREKFEIPKSNLVRSSNHAELMEIDKTSTAVNVERNQSNRNFQAPFKRDFSKNNTNASFAQQKKVQRINNVEDEADYARTIVYDEQVDEDFDHEYDGQSNEISDETSSIFLGH